MIDVFSRLVDGVRSRWNNSQNERDYDNNRRTQYERGEYDQSGYYDQGEEDRYWDDSRDTYRDSSRDTSRDAYRDYREPVRETSRNYRETARDTSLDYREPVRERERQDIDYISRGARSSSRGSNVIEFQNAYVETRMSMILTAPADVQEAMSICDHIRNNKSCVVNLEGVERKNAQRIADFLGGSAYALGGEIQRVSNEIFVVAPASVQIAGDLKEELAAAGFEFKKVSSF